MDSQDRVQPHVRSHTAPCTRIYAQKALVRVEEGLRAWKRSAASTAATRSASWGGTSALSVIAMRSSRCSRSGPSSGLNVAISSGRHLHRRSAALC